MATLFGFTDPFADLLDMQRQMDRLMNTFATTTDLPLLTTGVAAPDVGRRGLTTTTTRPAAVAATTATRWAPRLDVRETDKSFVVHAELPGCNREDIKLSVVDNNRLVLEGHKRTQAKQKGESWVRRERFEGSFYRTLLLPQGVEAGQVQANYENGVLEVVVPKPQAAGGAKRQTIDIKTFEGAAKPQRPQEEQPPAQPQEELQQPRETQEMEEQPLAQQEAKAPEGGAEPQPQPQQAEQPLAQQQREEAAQLPQEKQTIDIKTPEAQPQPTEQQQTQEGQPQQQEQPKQSETTTSSAGEGSSVFIGSESGQQ
jgi:HSP20 family protein